MLANPDPCPTCGARNLRPSTTQPLRPLRISALLSTNNAPLQHEKPAIFDTIRNSKDILVDLDSRISEAQDILNHLIRERTQAASNLRDAKTLLHPIRRLPDDVLKHLFITCTRSPEACVYDSIYGDCLDENASPWTLSQTCRRWRNIVLETSRLWSRIDLNFDLEHTSVSRTAVAIRVGLYINRARGHDLALVLKLSDREDVPSHPVFSALLSCASQWKFLVVSGPVASLKVLDPCEGFLDALRFIYINIKPKQPPSPADKILAMFRFAPHLRYVQLCNADDAERALLLPWSQITLYEGSECLGDETNHLKVLPQMSSLQSLRLFCDKPSALPPTPSGRVNLPLLLNLTLSEGVSARAGSLGQCFGMISAPSLSWLQLVYTHRLQISFPKIIESDAYAITTLEIVCRFDSHPDNVVGFFEMLSYLPSISRLTVRAEGCTEEFFSKLTYHSDGNSVIPCLTSLDLHLSSFAFTEPTAFVDMLESRRPPSMCGTTSRRFLEEVKLDKAFEMGRSLIERWHMVCDGGLLVEYGTHNVDLPRGPDEQVKPNGRNLYDGWFPGMPGIF